MVEQDAMPYFLSSVLPGRRLVQPEFTAADLQTRSTERVLWQGHAAVAEFALSDGELAPPRWSLPDTTEVTVTDRRVAYAHVSGEVTSGETRWLWPQHVRVQPGARTADSISEIHLVCGPADGNWPTLVLAGGDVTTVRDADRIANLLRRAIVQFRLDNADGLGLSTPQSRMLSRLLITPEFGNYPGGAGQTVSLPGAFPLIRADDFEPAPVPSQVPDADRSGDETRLVPVGAYAGPPRRADSVDTVDLASRASTIAERVAELVRASAFAGSPADDHTVRLSPARFAANSAQHRGAPRRPGSDRRPA